MGSDKDIQNNRRKTICLHAFSDLSHISPAVFVYLLKECYLCGTRTATQKFKVLQQHVTLALHNTPKPGPATFTVQCLYIVPLLGLPYGEGFSHLLMSSMRRVLSRAPESILKDFPEAKGLAVQLFLDILSCSVVHSERILIKISENFEVELKDVGEALCGSSDIAKAHIERHISRFMESESYVTAVTLSERFSIQLSGDSFLLKMMRNNQFKPAEKWATLMGKPMICLVIQKYLDMKMLKCAYDMIKKNNLKLDFPDVHHLYKESVLKKLAEKGCWDIAELRAQKDRQLMKYLLLLIMKVYLALEAGYIEKVKGICERYSLEGFDDISVSDESSRGSRFLDLNNLILDDIVWVDEINGLLAATNYIEGCKVIGLDCEWKPNYEKGILPNKVSIMQIASENRAFIFDLIKLYQDEPKALNHCFSRILCSPNVLKLGYNLQCDLHQLSHSYGDLECFRYYEMLLDIQKFFNKHSGGLSGLAEKILGAGLNKTRRNSNWEQRPLSQNQIEYAALDAVVLVHIFRHVHNQPQSPGRDEQSKGEWKSHIVSHMGRTRPKKLA